MPKNKKKKSITLILRNYFITGVVVLIPIGFTLYLSKVLIGISSKIIPENINPNSYLPFAIPGVEILISVIFITIVGGLSLSFLGKRILKLIDDLFKRIPVLRTIYSAIVQMTETFSNKDDNDKKSVVLVEYPRKGVWAVGFATKENTGEMSIKTKQKLYLDELLGAGSRIIGLTSEGNYLAMEGYGPVSVAKVAMEAIIRQIGWELGQYGITANSVQAGVTPTRALTKINDKWEDWVENTKKRNPMRRTTTPEDVAGTVSMLLQPEADFINCSIIYCDGGEHRSGTI